MPFTLAHPAIILPLVRSRYFSATGLVVGSIAPDFEYFFKMGVNSEYSHTVAGLFYFDIPVTLFIALLFHLVIKKNFIYSLPLFFQRRFESLLEFDFLQYLKKNVWIFLLSALLGSASHVFWDSFTHNGTFFVKNISLYKTTHVPFDGVRYPLFYALQHISTWVGITVVGTYVLSIKPAKVSVTSNQKFLYWLTVIILTTVVTWIRFVIRPLGTDIGNLVVTIISGLVLALVCCGFINFKQTNIAQESLNG